MNGSEEGSVQPSSTLRDEFRELVIYKSSAYSDMKNITIAVGGLTEVGTSVDAFALLTYFKLQTTKQTSENQKPRFED